MAEGPIRLRVREIERRIENARLRMPFKFGIATLTEVPILTLRLVAEDAEGRTAVGYSADVLPALWFDKNPEKGIDEKIDDQITMSRLAEEKYLEAGSELTTPFQLWWDVYPKLKIGAAERGINLLTAGFGSSFAERAMIDAACRLAGASFFEATHANLFGIEPHRVHHELAGFPIAAALPERPLDRIGCRHTVGLGDPLRVSEIDDENRLDDGLPQALEEDLAAYGLKYFKIKIGADREWNLDRLTRIAELLDERISEKYSVTLDGNEQVEELADIVWLLEQLESNERGKRLREAILFIEQPLNRDRALLAELKPDIEDLARVCPLIIDESDSDVTALLVARNVGYSGISCKNCKGVFKAILNKFLIAQWNAQGAGAPGEPTPWVLSSEDLTNIGVVPLQEDLATIATLGIDHSERNGHHYFRGLDHLSEKERTGAVRHHGDLYRVEGNLASLRIEKGVIRIGTIHAPGYGYSCEIDFESRMTLDAWQAERTPVDA